MTPICAQIPEVCEPHHGFHRKCSQRFTMNQNRLKVKEDSPEVENTASSRSPRKKKVPGPLFTPECIFCEKSSPIWIKKEPQQWSPTLKLDPQSFVFHIRDQLDTNMRKN